MNSINEGNDDSEEEPTMIHVEENRVYFHADVSRENCFQLIESLRKAQEYVAVQYIKNEFEEMGKIFLYLFSDGGELYAGLNVADFIQKSKVDIITINEGCVSSACVRVGVAE